MSIHIEKNGQKIRLNTFTTEDVYSYLAIVFNVERDRFKKIANSQLTDAYWVKLDAMGFFIYAKDTQIELTFTVHNVDAINEVIHAMTKWNKFSETEHTFYAIIEDDTSICVIFENGFNSEIEYRQNYRKSLTYIREFNN